MISDLESKPADPPARHISTLFQHPGDARHAWFLVRSLLGLGLLAPLLMVVVSTISIGRQPGHNLVSDTFSDLGAQDATHPDLFRAGMVAFGILIIGFAAGLANANAGFRRLVPSALAVFGFSVACAGVFRDYSEVDGVPRNAEGFAHNTFGIMAILTLLVAIIASWTLAGESRALFRIRHLTLVAAISIVIAGTTFNLGPPRFDGAVEMVLYVTALTWIFSLAKATLISVFAWKSDHALTHDDSHPAGHLVASRPAK